MRRWTVLAEDGEVTLETDLDGRASLVVFQSNTAVVGGVQMTREQFERMADAVADARSFLP